MVNLILNVTADGSWQAPAIPQRTQTVTIQARTSAAVSVRYRGQTTVWTVKADASRTFTGQFWPGDIEVQAGGGVVIEVEANTRQWMS